MPNLDIGADDDDEDEFLIGSSVQAYTFDFVDPLTGETLATDSESESNGGIPGLL